MLLVQEKISETGYKLTGGSNSSSGSLSRQLANEKTHRKLQRLHKRLLNVASQQHRTQAEENEEISAS